MKCQFCNNDTHLFHDFVDLRNFKCTDCAALFTFDLELNRITDYRFEYNGYFFEFDLLNIRFFLVKVERNGVASKQTTLLGLDYLPNCTPQNPRLHNLLSFL